MKKGDGPVLEPGMIPTKFKRYIVKEEKKLNELSPEAKVVAAITKCLAIQGTKDGSNYYVAGDRLYCPDINVTSGRATGKSTDQRSSYAASGRFKIGKFVQDALSFGVMAFRLRFRDSEDEMGLPDLTIEEADMNELPRSTPLAS
jgi:hypothetical protein